MNRLLLLDIDGTLLSARGVFRRALSEALAANFGAAPRLDEYDFSGKTDPQIVRELMRGAGLTAEVVAAGLPAALADYSDRLLASIRPEDVTAKPGVHALIERLAGRAGVVLALLTGNLEPCARAKLAPLGLNGFFPFGAFGSDAEDRRRLPALAVERAFLATGRRFRGKQVVVVGDSIHDVRCGRSLGVRAVAVASGKTPADRLAAESPDALLPSLADTEAALAAILA